MHAKFLLIEVPVAWLRELIISEIKTPLWCIIDDIFLNEGALGTRK